MITSRTLRSINCQQLVIRQLSISRSKLFAPATSNDRESNQKIGEKTEDKPVESTAAKSTSKANYPSSDGGPVSWKSLLIGGGILAGLTGYFFHLKKLKQEKIELEKRKVYGQAAIGGSFELVDTQGKTRKSEEFLGKWLLIYFGFTHCPDICPEELDKLATVVEKLAEHKVEVVPLFISVDPERDTPALVDKYLKEFSNRFIGLTGTKEQVEQATRAYRVYYSVGPKDKDNDYIVDHTIISYLIGPKGELVDYFGQTKLAPEIEATILYKIKTYKG